jgi:uncharacterized protein
MRKPPPTSKGAPSHPSRRRFLKRALLAAGALGVTGAGWTLVSERNWLRLQRVTVPCRGLPPALEGLTIGQLSDLHCGPYISAEQIRRGVEMVQACAPDLIVVTGDYISHGTRHLAACAAELAALRAPYGVYGVLGNHDLWTEDVPAVTKAVTGAGLHLLVNQSAPIEVKGTRWWLGGVADLWSGAPDLAATFAGAPADDFRILLCHEPDFADQAAAAGIALQISGHSHGGQVRLPFLGAPILPRHGRKYPIGLQPIDNTGSLVYTNVGLGVITPPIRFGCRPEVTVLTLTAAGAR